MVVETGNTVSIKGTERVRARGGSPAVPWDQKQAAHWAVLLVDQGVAWRAALKAAQMVGQLDGRTARLWGIWWAAAWAPS